MDQQIKNIRNNMKETYLYLKQEYMTLPESAKEENKKMTLAQITIYCGLANRDYAMFKKGIERFEKYSLKILEMYQDPNIRLTGMIQCENDADTSNYANTTNPFLTFRNRKIEYYTGMYNQLPAGYFRSN